MNKMRIFSIFILIALLITCIGVSFASSDFDNHYAINSVLDDDVDDGYLSDDDLDYNLDDDSDDEDSDYDLDDDDSDDEDSDYDLDDDDSDDYDDYYWFDEDWYVYDNGDYWDDFDWDEYCNTFDGNITYAPNFCYYDNLDFYDWDYSEYEYNYTDGNNTTYKAKLLLPVRFAHNIYYKTGAMTALTTSAMDYPDKPNQYDENITSKSADKPSADYQDDIDALDAYIIKKSTQTSQNYNQKTAIKSIDLGDLKESIAPEDCKNTSKTKINHKTINIQADEDVNILAILAALLVSLIVLI